MHTSLHGVEEAWLVNYAETELHGIRNKVDSAANAAFTYRASAGVNPAHRNAVLAMQPGSLDKTIQLWLHSNFGAEPIFSLSIWCLKTHFSSKNFFKRNRETSHISSSEDQLGALGRPRCLRGSFDASPPRGSADRGRRGALGAATHRRAEPWSGVSWTLGAEGTWKICRWVRN